MCAGSLNRVSYDQPESYKINAAVVRSELETKPGRPVYAKKWRKQMNQPAPVALAHVPRPLVLFIRQGKTNAVLFFSCATQLENRFHSMLIRISDMRVQCVASFRAKASCGLRQGDLEKEKWGFESATSSGTLYNRSPVSRSLCVYRHWHDRVRMYARLTWTVGNGFSNMTC